MNNRTLSTIIFALIAFLLIGLILKILPYIILGGIIAYIVFKCYAFINGKVNKKQNRSDSFNEASTYQETYKEDSDVNTNEAIDVDYKEVK